MSRKDAAATTRRAIEAVDRVFHDVRVPPEVTRENLLRIRSHVDELLEVMPEETN